MNMAAILFSLAILSMVIHWVGVFNENIKCRSLFIDGGMIMCLVFLIATVIVYVPSYYGVIIMEIVSTIDTLYTVDAVFSNPIVFVVWMLMALLATADWLWEVEFNTFILGGFTWIGLFFIALFTWPFYLAYRLMVMVWEYILNDLNSTSYDRPDRPYDKPHDYTRDPL